MNINVSFKGIEEEVVREKGGRERERERGREGGRDEGDSEKEIYNSSHSGGKIPISFSSKPQTMKSTCKLSLGSLQLPTLTKNPILSSLLLNHLPLHYHHIASY